MGIILRYYLFCLRLISGLDKTILGHKRFYFAWPAFLETSDIAQNSGCSFKQPCKFSVNFTLSKDRRSALTMHSNPSVENLDSYLWYIYSSLEESKETYRSFGEMADFVNYWDITTIISCLLSPSYSIYSRAANLLLFFRAFVITVDYICMTGFDHVVMNIVSQSAK